METPKYDYSTAIDPDLWSSILKHLEPISYRVWCSLRLVSKYWYSTVSRKKTVLMLSDGVELQKVLLNDLSKIGRSLSSFFLQPDINLLEQIKSGSANGLENFLEKCELGFTQMVQLEELSISNLEWLVPASYLVKSASNWPNLRSIRLSGLTNLTWQMGSDLFQQFPKLESLAFDGIIIDSSPQNEVEEVDLNDRERGIWKMESLRSVEVRGKSNLNSMRSDSMLRYLPLSNLVNLTITDVYGELEPMFATLAQLEHLKSLILRNTDLWHPIGGHEYQKGDFPNLESLELYYVKNSPGRSSERMVYLGYVFQLPKLKFLTTCVELLASPPVPAPGQSPPPINGTLEKWHLWAPSTTSTGPHPFSWASLQLVPAISELVIEKPNHFPSFINDLPSLQKLVIRRCHLDVRSYAPLVRRISFWHNLTQLCFYQCSLPYVTFSLIARHAKNLTHFTLTYDSSACEDAIKLLTPLPLTHLTLTGCFNLGTTILRPIATIQSLQYLDLSRIPSIWTQHLRLLAPLTRLRGLAHVQPNRSPSDTKFSLLTGLWPRLETLTLEQTANRHSLAEAFGPLVSVIFE